MVRCKKIITFAYSVALINKDLSFVSITSSLPFVPFMRNNILSIEPGDGWEEVGKIYSCPFVTLTFDSWFLRSCVPLCNY